MLRPAMIAVLAAAALLAGCGSATDLTADVQRSDRQPVQSGSADHAKRHHDKRGHQKPARHNGRSVHRSPVKLPNIVGSVRSFSSPTGNIGCHISEDAARCDIAQRSFTPPPKPGSCGLDWGHAIQVGAAKAEFACIGDTVAGSRRVLKYRTSTVVGDFGCSSAVTGVKCVNRHTGHGFSISREVARTF